jgi:hypothetical protein
MPVYKATVSFIGKIDIEYEAQGDPEAGERAEEVFCDMDKGNMGMADFEITGIHASRMLGEDLAYRKAEARGQI